MLREVLALCRRPSADGMAIECSKTEASNADH